MKHKSIAALLLSIATGLAVAQETSPHPHPEIPDAITADGSHYTLEFENEYVRALRIHYGPGEVGNMHNHPHSVTVFLTEGKLKMMHPDGQVKTGVIPAGAAIYEEAGPHQPTNLADKPFEAVRVELKDQNSASMSAVQKAWAVDAGRMGEKFTDLADAMKDRYNWRPSEGVRSVADVFNLIVVENGMLLGALAGKPAASAGNPEPIRDSAKMRQAIADSSRQLRDAISGLSASDLASPVKLFGMNMTKQDAIMLLLNDQHEHLGQSIAYARTNGITPPWSK